jgi:hydroxysqualene dehydroxylase
MAIDAIVIGGGFAGFAAATALVESGARILLLEARPGLGGRATAFTDPDTGERVDNGQHILMGCYTDTMAFLDRIGASDRVRWQSGLRVSMVDRAGHHTMLSLPALPSPLHFLAGVLAWDALSWSERLSVLRIGSMIKPSAASPLGRDRLGISVRAWLEQNGQAPRLCELFWEPLALAALNQSIDQADASHFIGVLERVFGPDPAAAALVLPAVPLDELYAEPARAWLSRRGHEVRVNAPAGADRQ